MNIDDLITTLFKDVATPQAGGGVTPVERIRQGVVLGAPPVEAPRPPMSQASPVPSPMRVGGAVSEPAPAPMAAPASPAPAPAPLSLNPLGTMARGYQSGGLFGAISNLFDEPQLLQRQAQEEARVKGQENQTVQAIVARDPSITPAQAAVIARDPAMLREVFKPKEAMKPTDDEREYERAQKDPAFRQFLMDMKKAGASAITVDQRGENAFAKKAAEIEAQRYGDLANDAKSARQNLANLDALEQSLNAYEEGSFFGSGSFGNMETAARAAALGLGIGNAETVGAAELANSIRNKLTLAARSTADGAGMPGALSDADREFLKATTAGIDKTPAGNKKIIDITRALEKRRLQIASMAAKYVEQFGRLDSGFEQQVEQFAIANPLFKAEPGAGAPVKVQTIEEALKLPKGTRFITPDGREKVR